MSAVGNLNDYVKYQMAQGLEKGEGGTGSAAAQLGIGLAMAQQMAQQFQPDSAPPVLGSAASRGGPQPASPAASASAAMPRLYSPAEIAQSLGVTEADVMASLEAGDLKGKRIGTAWRISQTALDEFLSH
jgi:excisionase family DNA binding protein